MASPQKKKSEKQSRKPAKSVENPDPTKEREKGDVHQQVKEEEAEQIKDNPGAL